MVTTGPFPKGVGGHHLGGMQTNWNGITGRIELVASERTHIELARVFPDIARRSVKIRIALRNPAGGTMTISASAWNTDSPHEAPPKTIGITGPGMEVDYPLGKDARLWDEFHPTLYKLTIRIGKEVFTTDFGLREFRRKGTVFTVNGRPTLLRGTHDGAHFPITDYAPADVEPWLKIFRAAKSFGINHFRFHTWTPPEAAFTAADMTGLYLQPELPSNPGFAYGENKEHDLYETRMGEAMLSKWANHPSFVMLALGNEISIPHPENRQAMSAIISRFRALDPTRLYAEGSNNQFGHPTLNPGDDYWTTMRVTNEAGKLQVIRASFSSGNGLLNTEPPSTLLDYKDTIHLSSVPLIGHESGQYTFFPDLAERKKYTGVFRLRNYDVIEKRMQRHGVLQQNADFARASGALAILCYRQEIEAYLRTPGFGGFQLLDLCDDQEQGTSLVGVLDSFYESKGLIDPADWREFCSATVPLLRFAKYTWTTGEPFSANAQIAHYGPAPLNGVIPQWTLFDANHKPLLSGQLSKVDLPTGTVSQLGLLKFDLGKIPAPRKLTLELEVGGFRNHYPIWVYPKLNAQPAVPGNIVLTRKLDEALAALAKGSRVLFIPVPKEIESCSVKCGFETVFWNMMFAKQPPTMGILCDPNHPLFEQFPTDYYSNWQWFPIVSKGRAILLNGLPSTFHPIVQVIDSISSCRKLGLIWEAKVGAGQLLVCTSDLPSIQDKPEGKQLFASLLHYASSPQFHPQQNLPPETIKMIFTQKPATSVPKTIRKDE